MTLPGTTAIAAEPSDAELAAGALEGDSKAFRTLVQRHLSMVYNYLYRMTRNHELSEEIAQETFMKAYQHLRNFDRTRRLRPWLLRIASNSAISALRRQGREVSLNALEDEGYWGEADHQPVDDMLVRLERKWSVEEVLKSLDQLNEKYRNVLLLRYQQELSYEEISIALDMPLNTVRTWIRRGLEKLKYELKEITPDV